MQLVSSGILKLSQIFGISMILTLKIKMATLRGVAPFGDTIQVECFQLRSFSFGRSRRKGAESELSGFENIQNYSLSEVNTFRH